MAKNEVVTPAHPVSIFWFRRDLRLHDNHGLWQAMQSGYPVQPVFIFDSNILSALPDPHDRRVDFIHRALAEIQAKLVSLGVTLDIYHGTPAEAFLRFQKKYDIRHVFTNKDYEPYAIQRDHDIKLQLAQKGISFHAFKDQVIFEEKEVLKSDSTPYTVYTPYSRMWKAKYAETGDVQYSSEKNTNAWHQQKPLPIPSLKEIGFEKTDLIIPSAAPDEDIIRHYEETRNLPAVRGTSRLSVHLRFGTVSVRQLVAKANQLNPVWLNELIWREFFMMILFHFPQVVTKAFKAKYDLIPWRNNEKEFALWCRGETGYPLVDAGMRELNETGFMHNRVRMVVASFLTKHLLIDWRWGESYFAEKLLDYELSSNNGNWQWCAGCGCDAAPYFRIFNPTEQQKKFDPDLQYIREWVKEFDFGYRAPMVDHAEARKRVLEVFKRALGEG